MPFVVPKFNWNFVGGTVPGTFCEVFYVWLTDIFRNGEKGAQVHIWQKIFTLGLQMPFSYGYFLAFLLRTF